MEYKNIFVVDNSLPKVLSNDEICDLFQKMHNGNSEARGVIAEHNIRLVIHVVLKMFKYVGYDLEELIAVGNLGLMKAINTFDLSRGIYFSSFARQCIRNEILCFLEKNEKHRNTTSLYSPKVITSTGNSVNVQISSRENFEKSYIESEAKKILRELIMELPYREREVIMMYYGFYDEHRYKRSEVMEKLGVSHTLFNTLKKRAFNIVVERMIEEELIEDKKTLYK